jgi:hypothetical protein
MDDSSPNDIEKFANDLGVNYPILVGEDKVGNAYGGLQFLLATSYIGRDVKVVDKIFGLKTRNEIEGSKKTSRNTRTGSGDRSSELNRSGLIPSSSAEVVSQVGLVNIYCAQPLRRHRHPKLRP